MILGLILLVWQIIILIQQFFGLGTAYRLTKNGSDNGIALFGWLFLMNLASIVPGLGIYLWFKYRDLKPTPNDYSQVDIYNSNKEEFK